LISGLYTPRHKIYTVNSSSRGQSRNRKIIPTTNEISLDTSFITIAESLQKNGYESVSIGKWHLGDPGVGGPEEHGFSKNIAGTHVGHPKSYFSPYKNKTLPDGPEGEYLPDRMATEAIGQIKRMKDKPFFLYLPFFSVHTPIQAKNE
jgi:arylsulfatase A-like enzyme